MGRSMKFSLSGIISILVVFLVIFFIASCSSEPTLQYTKVTVTYDSIQNVIESGFNLQPNAVSDMNYSGYFQSQGISGLSSYTDLLSFYESHFSAVSSNYDSCLDLDYMVSRYDSDYTAIKSTPRLRFVKITVSAADFPNAVYYLTNNNREVTIDVIQGDDRRFEVVAMVTYNASYSSVINSNGVDEILSNDEIASCTTINQMENKDSVFFGYSVNDVTEDTSHECLDDKDRFCMDITIDVERASASYDNEITKSIKIKPNPITFAGTAIYAAALKDVDADFYYSLDVQPVIADGQNLNYDMSRSPVFINNFAVANNNYQMVFFEKVPIASSGGELRYKLKKSFVSPIFKANANTSETILCWSPVPDNNNQLIEVGSVDACNSNAFVGYLSNGNHFITNLSFATSYGCDSTTCTYNSNSFSRYYYLPPNREFKVTSVSGQMQSSPSSIEVHNSKYEITQAPQSGALPNMSLSGNTFTWYTNRNNNASVTPLDFAQTDFYEPNHASFKFVAKDSSGKISSLDYIHFMRDNLVINGDFELNTDKAKTMMTNWGNYNSNSMDILGWKLEFYNKVGSYSDTNNNYFVHVVFDQDKKSNVLELGGVCGTTAAKCYGEVNANYGTGASTKRYMVPGIRLSQYLNNFHVKNYVDNLNVNSSSGIKVADLQELKLSFDIGRTEDPVLKNSASRNCLGQVTGDGAWPTAFPLEVKLVFGKMPHGNFNYARQTLEGTNSDYLKTYMPICLCDGTNSNCNTSNYDLTDYNAYLTAFVQSLPSNSVLCPTYSGTAPQKESFFNASFYGTFSVYAATFVSASSVGRSHGYAAYEPFNVTSTLWNTYAGSHNRESLRSCSYLNFIDLENYSEGRWKHVEYDLLGYYMTSSKNYLQYYGDIRSGSGAVDEDKNLFQYLTEIQLISGGMNYAIRIDNIKITAVPK